MKNKLRLLALAMAVLSAIFVFPTAYASDKMEATSDEPQYEIIISGEKNIAAYKAAGIIHTNTVSPQNSEIVAEMATGAPTKVWNLYTQGGRITTYSMSTWIYSAYLYDPADYGDIWQTVTPNQVQSMTIQCYKEDGTKWGNGNTRLNSDETYVYGIKGVRGERYYFTYTSVDKKQISGTLDIA